MVDVVFGSMNPDSRFDDNLVVDVVVVVDAATDVLCRYPGDMFDRYWCSDSTRQTMTRFLYIGMIV